MNARKVGLIAVYMLLTLTLLVSCAAPTPAVVEKIVKETVVVEKEVPVEKVVKETVVVEKEVEKLVTASPKEVAKNPLTPDDDILIAAAASRTENLDIRTGFMGVVQIEVLANIMNKLIIQDETLALRTI